MSPAWPLNRFWKTLQSVSVSYPYLVPQICPQLGIVQATVILLCSPLIWRAPSIIISRPFLMQCSWFFVFLKNWMAVKLSIYLPSDFLFSFSGPLRAVFSTLFADFSFHFAPVLGDILVYHAVLQNQLPDSVCFLFGICIQVLSLPDSFENLETKGFKFYT